jgi:hypothetical protein
MRLREGESGYRGLYISSGGLPTIEDHRQQEGHQIQAQQKSLSIRSQATDRH